MIGHLGSTAYGFMREHPGCGSCHRIGRIVFLQGNAMAATPNDYQHPECSAHATSRAAPNKSPAEHPFSEGVLKLIYRRFGQVSETVDGTNLSFQKPGVTKKLTIGRLAYPILCETHNGLLSPFDTAGQDMFVAMDRLNESVADPQLSSRDAACGWRQAGAMVSDYVLCGTIYIAVVPLAARRIHEGHMSAFILASAVV